MRILFSILILLILPIISFSQEDEKGLKKRPPRTDNFIRLDGIRVEYDLSRPFQYLWNKGNRYGSQISVDMEIAPNVFPVFETGWETQNLNSDYIDYKSSGSYSGLGVNYNLLVAEKKSNKDILYLGLRYCFSFSSQKVKSYTTNSYWGETAGSFSSQSFSAHWAELLFGTKVEILHNVFLGWAIRGKIRISYKDYEIPPVYFIPGYGKAENGFNFDFSYSIAYNLPVNVSKIFTKKVKTQ